MSVRVNVYLVDEAPPLPQLAMATGVPSAAVEARRDGSLAVAVLVGGARVELAYLPQAEMTSHLGVLRAYVAARYRVEDPALPARLDAVRAVVAATLEPGFDEAGSCARFLTAIAAQTNAFLLHEDGLIEDARGLALAYPVHLEGDTSDPQGEAAQRDGGTADGAGAAASPTRRSSRSAEDVAKRALILAALAWRSWLEVERSPDAAAQLVVFRAWLDEHGLLEAMTARERALADAELGRWAEQDVIDRGWAIEGVGVLAWALHLAELPPHDTKVQTPKLAKQLGLFSAEPAALKAKLRSAEELSALGARLTGVSWRLHEFATAPGVVDFVAVSRSAWFGAFDLDGIPIVDGDLAIGGVPISRAADLDVTNVQSIAAERHRALSWLRGIA